VRREGDFTSSLDTTVPSDETLESIQFGVTDFIQSRPV